MRAQRNGSDSTESGQRLPDSTAKPVAPKPDVLCTGGLKLVWLHTCASLVRLEVPRSSSWRGRSGARDKFRAG